MAIRKAQSVGLVDFIHPLDDAIDVSLDASTGKPVSDIAAYKEDWDFEKHCTIAPGKQATIFRLNFAIDLKRSTAIKNASLGALKNEDESRFLMGSNQVQTVKSILVDIVNPEDVPLDARIPFKRGKDGYASDETLEELERLGINDDIFSFYHARKPSAADLKKK